MEAVDFIYRRETGAVPSELALWKEVETDIGDIV